MFSFLFLFDKNSENQRNTFPSFVLNRAVRSYNKTEAKKSKKFKEMIV